MTGGVIDPVANTIVDLAAGGDTLADTGEPIGSVLSLEAAGYTSFIPSKYGDGFDGPTVFAGPTSFVRDLNATDVAFLAGAAVNARMCTIFATGTLNIVAIPTGGLFTHPLTTSGTNVVDGNNAAVNVAGTNQQGGLGSVGTLFNAAAGAAGATNAGTNGTSVTVTSSWAGGRPGVGGTAGTGSTGAGGAAGTLTEISLNSFPRHGELQTLGNFAGGIASPSGPSGGGDGTAGASGAGGGGAIGGPPIQIYARRVLRSAANPNTACIVARGGKGGNGGTPAAGNRGGGAGAPGSGGGVVRIVCEELAGTPHVDCVSVTGGDGGTAGNGTGTGTAGTGAPAGFGGRLIVWCRSAIPLCVVTDRTAVGGNAGIGTAGGIATPALCTL